MSSHALKLALAFVLTAGWAHAAEPDRSRLPDDYVSWSAPKKAKYLWQERVLPTAYKELPPIRSSLLDLRKSFLSVAFDHASDEMPEGRRKLIHGFGTVAWVMLRVQPNSFTGFFAPDSLAGSSYSGFLRASVAGAPSAASFRPGFALKLFRYGAPSANLFAMNSLSGQTSWNFFEKTFSTILPEPDSIPLMLVAKAFARVKEDPNVISLDDAAAHGVSNAPPSGAPVKAPARVEFVPRADVSRCTGGQEDFRAQLARLQPGTVLYDVIGYESATATTGEPIGTIMLVTRFCASQWGDEKLFFQHPR